MVLTQEATAALRLIIREELAALQTADRAEIERLKGELAGAQQCMSDCRCARVGHLPEVSRQGLRDIAMALAAVSDSTDDLLAKSAGLMAWRALRLAVDAAHKVRKEKVS